MKKFIIDSNILIEFFKGNKKAKQLIDLIYADDKNEYLISIDIIEEVLYILVRYFSKKPYWELKNKPETTKNIYETLLPLINMIIKRLFKVIDTPASIKETFFNICKENGILPKDALLLSLAIECKADFIISLDRDLYKLNSIKILSSYEELLKQIQGGKL